MEPNASEAQGTSQPQQPQAGSNAAGKNTLMGVLSYVGPFVVVSYLIAKDDPFVKFHIKQGLVLLVIEAASWVLGMMLWQLWMLLNLVNLAVIVLSVVGIVNVVQGKEKELPLVGKFGAHFSI